MYLHGAVVGLFLLSFLLAIGYLAAYRDRSPALFTLGLGVLGLLLVQMAIGELQWRTELPWRLVLVHVDARSGGLGGHRRACCALLPAPSVAAFGQHLN